MSKGKLLILVIWLPVALCDVRAADAMLMMFAKWNFLPDTCISNAIAQWPSENTVTARRSAVWRAWGRKTSNLVATDKAQTALRMCVWLSVASVAGSRAYAFLHVAYHRIFFFSLFAAYSYVPGELHLLHGVMPKRL